MEERNVMSLDSTTGLSSSAIIFGTSKRALVNNFKYVMVVSVENK